MSLDRTNGEVLDGLPASLHVVVDPRHLAGMSNLLVEYKVPGKFRATTKRRPLYDDAMTIARERFAEAGALLPIGLDATGVLVQVYPKESKVAVVVARSIAGKEHFVVRDYDLPKVVIDSLLSAAGKRPREH